MSKNLSCVGTKWLIDEHRKCIAELKRLKIMIADLAKYITVLREKGHQLFNSYLALKKHLDQLKIQLEQYHSQEKQQQGRIEKVRAEMEEWKGKARELQHTLDELKHKYHDLQKEHKVRYMLNIQKKDFQTICFCILSFCVIFL